MSMTAIRVWSAGVRAERQRHGLRGMVKRGGWKLVGLVLAYYLVRDLTLYVILPLLAVRMFGG